MRKLLIASVLSIVIGSSAVAHQPDYDANSPVPGLKPFFYEAGGYLNKRLFGKIAYLEIVVSNDAIQDNFDRILNSGAMIRALAEKAMTARPLKKAYYVAEQGAAFAESDAFADPRVESVHVIAEIKMPDEYGRVRFAKMFSFDMNRATFSKIEWVNFDPSNFSHIASDFAVSNWFYGNLYNEYYGFPLKPPPDPPEPPKKTIRPKPIDEGAPADDGGPTEEEKMSDPG